MTKEGQSLRTRVIQSFLQFASPVRAGTVSVYAALTSALFIHIAQAYQSGGPEAVGALGISVGTGLFSSLLANHVYDAQKPHDTETLLREVGAALTRDTALREEVDQHLQALEITQQTLLEAICSSRLTSDDLASIAAVVRQELAQIGQPPASDPYQDALREAYLSYLYREVGRISFAGLDPRVAADSRARAEEAALGDIYVPLLTGEAARERDRASPAGVESGLDLRTDQGNFLSTVAQLNRWPRLVLLGDPGSGKTTFARFVVQCLAGETLGEEMHLERLRAPTPGREEPETWGWGAPLPVLVELRRLAATGLPPSGQPATASHLLDFLRSELTANTLGEFQLERLLRYPGALVVFDGLDEVPEAEQRRSQIVQLVEDFAALFPNCRLLVTSRTYAYRRQGWRLGGFHEAELRPFAPEQIEAFVDRWYEHTAIVRSRKREDARGRAVRLKQAIRTTPRLAELAARPLLLTLMAALHDWRGGDLPERRWELYEETVDLLLHRWNRGKVERNAQGEEVVTVPNLAAWLQVDRSQVRELLNRLAYEAHRRQPDLVGTADVLEADLASGLYELTKAPGVHPNAIVEFLQDRAGLLVAHGEKVYTFPHRTLQEYLAACHLTDLDYPDELAELVRGEPDRWREVALLAGGKAASGAEATIWALANALCPNECPVGAQAACDAWGALTAGLGLLESANLTRMTPRKEKTVGLLQDHLVRVLQEGRLPATERASAGRVLAQLGDPRPGVGLTLAGLPDVSWCEIPAGPFTLGSAEGEAGSFDDEQPQHPCEIPYLYCISKYPITVAQYQVFVDAGGYAEKRWWTEVGWQWREELERTVPEEYRSPFSLPNHPVVGVSWYEARAFTRWLTTQLHEHGLLDAHLVVDLPSEAEWEKAARGNEDARRYPWGKSFDPDWANCAETGIGTTSAVGCFPGGVSPYGVEECSGNVWEWTRSKWADYPYEAADGREDSEGEEVRVVRGGSWIGTDPGDLRVADRFRVDPWGRRDFLGFRCVVRPPGR